LMIHPVSINQNNRRLQRGNQFQRHIYENKRKWIERRSSQQNCVRRYPKSKKRDRRDDELPTATELRDLVRRVIGECETGLFFLVHITRDPMSQQFVRPPQSLGKRRQQLER